MKPAMIQIRNVPREVHRDLKMRAASEGMSMSDYILREMRKALAVPSRQEVLERLRSRPVRRFRQGAAELVRAERDRR
ncbi:MAG: FitA-like ribbon-helix-helix domain-containing protein [Terriglobales bacterium]